ncbi:hypothetical protein MTP04_20130 [Lysinibacillus sp. PLM2]|nr:hypothetical protein MTP04_20130 [Lysinibacillus sp. PLM2]
MMKKARIPSDVRVKCSFGIMRKNDKDSFLRVNIYEVYTFFLGGGQSHEKIPIKN